MAGYGHVTGEIANPHESRLAKLMIYESSVNLPLSSPALTFFLDIFKLDFDLLV